MMSEGNYIVTLTLGKTEKRTTIKANTTDISFREEFFFYVR